jgi:hypothetical protein
MRLKQFKVRLSLILAVLVPIVSFSASPLPPSGPPAPILTGIVISGSEFVDEGMSTQYVCNGKYSDGTTAPINATWGVSSSSASIDASGLLTAGDVSSDEVVEVYAEYGAYSVSKNVTVSYLAPLLNSLEISGPTALDEETSGQFSCVAHYADGSSVSVSPVWSVSSAIASINSSGLLVVGDIAVDQNVIVSASFDGITRDYMVSVKYVAPITLTTLSIDGAIVMDEGTSVQLSCVGSYSDGSTSVVSPVWSANSSFASIAGGLLTAGDVTADQSVLVSASLDGVSDDHTVLIKYITPVLEGIQISGPSSLAEGSSAQYTCVANFSDGTSQQVNPSWSENSMYASFGSDGTMSVGDVSSDQAVTVSASYQGKSDSIQVTIGYLEPDLLSLTIFGAPEVLEGYTTDYTCEASYSDGTSAEVTPTWSVNSSFAQINAAGTLTGLDVTRDEVLTVSASFGGLTELVSVTVKYEPPPVVLTGLTVLGPREVQELASITLSCQATYSDGTVEVVSPVWTDDSSLTLIDSSGKLTAGNFDEDGTVTVTASFGGTAAEYEITVWMVGTQVVYPLSGFEGRTVRAQLYDYVADEWHELGQFTNPAELIIQDVVPDQWYWISVLESNTTDNVWNEVHAEWLHM